MAGPHPFAMALVDGAALRLEMIACPMPALAEGQVRLRVHTCGVCRTDLHIVGELETKNLPLVSGHEIVGSVVEVGPGCVRLHVGERIGVPWLHGSCEHCGLCKSGLGHCGAPLHLSYRSILVHLDRSNVLQRHERVSAVDSRQRTRSAPRTDWALRRRQHTPTHR